MYPRIFQLGPFTLFSFGLMVIVGFMAASALASRLARQRGLPGDFFLDGGLLMLFGGVAGARLLFVLLNWRDFAANIGQVGAIWKGGMSFHGGAVCGILAGVLYARFRKLPVLPLADAAAPAIALGYALGRVGCLLNGCCYGVPTGSGWGLPGAWCEGGSSDLHYHPTQIYAAVINLGLCAALIWAYRRPHRAGQTMALYVGGYSVYRFLIESLRKGVTADVAAFGLTEAQIGSIVAVIAAAACWYWLQRKAPPAPPLTTGGPPLQSGGELSRNAAGGAGG